MSQMEILELKITITEIKKNVMSGLSSRVEWTEERSCEFEDRIIDIIQFKQ